MDALIVATTNNTNLTILTRDVRLVRCMESEVRFQTYALTSGE